MRLAFLILNFGTYEETTDCVSSIIEHVDTNDYKIVIVDNVSKDDSLNQLQSKYLSDARVDMISTGENLDLHEVIMLESNISTKIILQILLSY